MKKFALFFALFFIVSNWACRSSDALTEHELLGQLSRMKSAQAQTPETAHLADTLGKALHFYHSVADYKTRFTKAERSKGTLGPTEEIFMKFEKAFKIYMRWLNTDKKGVEVVYERGKRKGKLAVHKPGLFLGLMPVIFLDQNSPWIKEGSESYNIEDAGIGTFLFDFTEDVLKAAGENKLKVKTFGKTREENLSGEKVDVTFSNTQADSGYMAYRVEVLFDENIYLPVQMKLFDWQNTPMGIYTYQDLQINVGSDDPEFKKSANSTLLKIYTSQ